METLRCEEDEAEAAKWCPFDLVFFATLETDVDLEAGLDLGLDGEEVEFEAFAWSLARCGFLVLSVLCLPFFPLEVLLLAEDAVAVADAAVVAGVELVVAVFLLARRVLLCSCNTILLNMSHNLCW